MTNHRAVKRSSPDWARWTPAPSYCLGIEEEVMVLDPADWSLAGGADDMMTRLDPALAVHVSAETHDVALELASSPHATVAEVSREAAALRIALRDDLRRMGWRVAAAGTHPFAQWTDMHVSSGPRYQLVYQSMRELARREPTFALHVHVAISEPEAAVVLLNRLRAHVPLLLAISSNSPFWQGRDTGLASARTPIFQAFPRVGIPRAFSCYGQYVEVVDQLLRCDAIPEPTFLWWDVRLQPRFGTVEVRIMDVQTSLARAGSLAALVQSIAHLELEEGYARAELVYADEVLAENRFLAARDGMEAWLIDPVAERKVPARAQLRQLLDAARPHAQQLDCELELAAVGQIAEDTGAERQRRQARRSDLPHLVQELAEAF